MESHHPRGRRMLAALAVALSFGAVTSLAAAERGGSPHAGAAAASDAPSDDPLLGPIDTTRSSPDLKVLARLKKQAVAGDGAVNVIVGLRLRFVPEGLLDDKGVQAQHAQIAAQQDAVLSRLDKDTYGIAQRYDTLPYLALSVTPAALDALAVNEAVASIVPDGLLAPSLFTSVPQVEGDEARGFGFTGSGQTVAIVDTGVESTHPMLTGRVLSEACFSLRTQFLWIRNGDCPGGAASAIGPGTGAPCTAATGLNCFHGTHVAGIAAGRGSGSTFPNGVAPGASIISIQIFHRENDPATCTASGAPAAPCLLAHQSDEMAALQYLFTLRSVFDISAVNLSLGAGSFLANCDLDPLKPAVDQLRSVNIATVVAAGNGGSSMALSSPACISTAISVGSVDSTDTVAPSSNAASFLSLFAPGASITSSIPGGGLGTAGGTSMAAPHVSGALAVLRQANPALPVANLLALLRSTGRPVTDNRTAIPLTVPRIRILTALATLGVLRRTTESFRQTVPVGGVASGGLGLARRMGASGSGTIQISGVPVTLGLNPPVVTRAFLYWTTIGGADATVTFNSTGVTGTLLGATQDTDWGLGANRVYRADVTGLVSPGGNGSYPFSGLNPSFGGDGQGASLVVVWSQPGRYLLPPRGPQSTVVILDGARELLPGRVPSFTYGFGNLGIYRAPSSAALHLGVGDGQPWPDGPVVFNGSWIAGVNGFSGSDGPAWDDHTLPVSSALLPAGTTQAPVTLSADGDSLIWAYSALDVQQ